MASTDAACWTHPRSSRLSSTPLPAQARSRQREALKLLLSSTAWYYLPAKVPQNHRVGVAATMEFQEVFDLDAVRNTHAMKLRDSDCGIDDCDDGQTDCDCDCDCGDDGPEC